MKKLIAILLSVVVLALGADFLMKQQSAEQQPHVTINDVGTLNSTDRASAVAQFAGKPAVIFVVGTFCPHCQKGMPTYKTAIWDVYKEKAHVLANVIDGAQGARFDVEDIPQGYDAHLDYETLTGTTCDYVPSWVVLKGDGTVAESSCGGEKDVSVIATTLNALLGE